MHQNVIERSVIVCDTDEFTVDESWLSAAPAVEAGSACPAHWPRTRRRSSRMPCARASLSSAGAEEFLM